jgi:hypothetical protein
MNWNDIQLLDRVVTDLNKLGFKIKNSKYGQGSVGVYPLDDKNPLYSRDAEIYTGTLEHIMCWIRGVQHRDDYLKMLKATTDKKIKALEEKYIKKLKHQAMLSIINDPDKRIDKNAQDLIAMESK